MKSLYGLEQRGTDVIGSGCSRTHGERGRLKVIESYKTGYKRCLRRSTFTVGNFT